jgi:hypothetical protein
MEDPFDAPENPGACPIRLTRGSLLRPGPARRPAVERLRNPRTWRQRERGDSEQDSARNVAVFWCLYATGVFGPPGRPRVRSDVLMRERLADRALPSEGRVGWARKWHESGRIRGVFRAFVHSCTRIASKSLFVISGVRGGTARRVVRRAEFQLNSAGASSSRDRATRSRSRAIGCWSSGIGHRTGIGTVRGSR